MLRNTLGLSIVIAGLAGAPIVAQAPVQQPPASVGQTPTPGGMNVGQTGNPDPGVNFINVLENPDVRVLQVTLQPGAVRRFHAHNDVTFHMMVPITGSLELSVEKELAVTTVPGQAYYMVKGQTHSFSNKTNTPVQVMELFIKPNR